MDVTCEQCKAEYDFDDTLLGDKGTTVKCSQCGHVFRVLPPRREPQRSALKVRFARDGHVEAVGSLRELQQRIQAGDVGVDDELGRDGFTFRKLRDVPELKNFFARGAAPSKGPPARGAAEVALPPEARAKRTVVGIGPNSHDVPTSPRMQGLGPGGLAAQALAPTQPGGPAPRATLQGRAPVSNAPTTPGQTTPREPPPRRVPVSSAPTPSGTAPTAPPGPAYDASANNAPTVVPPATYPETAQRAPAAAPAALRLSESERPDGRAPEPRRGGGGDSIGPGALRAAARPRTTSAPPGGLGRKMRLRAEDDESPPERTSRGSSKLLVAVGLLALLGVGGFIANRRLSGKLESAEPAPAAAPELAADAAAANAAPLAEPPATPAADAALAAPAPEPPAQPAAAAPPPEPAPAAPPEPAADPATTADKAGGTKHAAARAPEKAPEPPPAAASSGREPKDYSGWVARGGQLLSRGDIAGARQAFEAAVAQRASGSEANSGLGSVLLALGQTREAIPYLERAASSGFADASVGLGDAYRKLGQNEEAAEAYETYLARMPKGSRANYVRLQLEGLGKRAKPSEPAPRPEPSSRPSNEYRPAGELTEAPPSAPSQPAPTEQTP
jgi:predicted Zn finger-like uncharacterized protein